MLKTNSSGRVAAKISALIVGAWLLSAILSAAFVSLVLGLLEEQQSVFTVVFWISWVFGCSLSVFLGLRIVRPMNVFLDAHLAQDEQVADLLDDTVRCSRWVFSKLGLLGLLGPLLWMSLVGGLTLGFAPAGNAWQLPLFVILGAFDSMLAATILFFMPQFWLDKILELLVGYRRDALAQRGLSLKWKIGLLGFGLATIPTLLVGSMSFHTANSMLDLEVGLELQVKLGRLNGEVGALLNSGADRMAVERHLSQAASKMGGKGYVHLGVGPQEFYRSDQAGSLSPRLYERIRQRYAQGLSDTKYSGNIEDLDSHLSYAYAFSSDGRLVSIAPLIHASSGTVSALFWLIVGITLVSMVVASLVGIIFASNLGKKIEVMAGMTRKIAKGRLVDDTVMFSDDELGTLGFGLLTMADNLRRVVTDMTALAGQISATCSQLLVKASAISTGADLQAQSVDETSSAVGDLGANIQAAADSLQNLADSVQETTEATNKVGDSFNMTLTEAGSLQSTVERTEVIVSTMVDSVSDVSEVIKELSDGAGRSAVSMAEIDRSISSVTSSASEASQVANQAIEAAQDGAVAVRRTIDGMDRIVQSTRRATEVIVGLGHRVEDIGSILGVIEEIADQTNLLALNAAIIAAQAGEHGRSFAVVADEIRSLAERTASSTREIAQMISDIQDTSGEANEVIQGGGDIVNEGVALSNRAGESLSQILISVQKAAENVEQIAQSTEVQAKSSEVVTGEIGRVAELANRIADAAGEQTESGIMLRRAYDNTLSTSRSLGEQVEHQAQENRQAMAAAAAMNEATSRASQAMLGQSSASDGILKAIEQIQEIAKNHAIASSEMGESTQALADKSARLKEEIEEFQV